MTDVIISVYRLSSGFLGWVRGSGMGQAQKNLPINQPLLSPSLIDKDKLGFYYRDVNSHPWGN
jgi:hypothetical protein